MKKAIATILLGAACLVAHAQTPPAAKPQPQARHKAQNHAVESWPAYAPTNPAHRSDGSDQIAWLLEPLRYEIGTTGIAIEVPDGFVTDYASIPQAFWSLGLATRGTYSRAAIIHDYLYWSQSCTKEQADHLMVLAMKESDVEGWKRNAIQAGLWIGAQKAWDDDKAERGESLPRIIPADRRKPGDPNMTWSMLRTQLKAAGIVDPPFPAEAPYCVYGNSTDVPIDKSRAYVPSPNVRPVLARMPSGISDLVLTPYSSSTGSKNKFEHAGPYISPPRPDHSVRMN
jgi:hypothetical protein